MRNFYACRNGIVTFCVVFKQFIQTQSIHTVNQTTTCYSNTRSRIVSST